jgi:hypothetical protein
MTPYREVPLYRVHRPHLDFDAKRPAGLVPIFTAAPAAEHQSTVGEVIARVSDIRDELNRLGMMAHTAMNQDASDMRNIMEDLAERLVFSLVADGSPRARTDIRARLWTQALDTIRARELTTCWNTYPR